MKYDISFIAKETHVGGIEIDLDPKLTDGEKEDAAIAEIEFAHPDLDDIEVTKIKELAVNV